jgi:hypothetical protein
VKLPACDFEMLNSAAGAMTAAESMAFAVAEPPPETLTLFTWGEVAVCATFTVTVIGG